MRKSFKKIVAVAMAATMVLGSSVVAFADGNPTSGTGSADGTGLSNGHLEQKFVSVTLPTSVGTTFNYIADPEDLVGKTKDNTSNKGKTKEGTEVTPNTDYIYFHNAAITADADKAIDAQTEGYSSTSDTVRVINKSSADIKLTVEAAVEANDDNMAIADAAADLATATTTPTVHFDLLTKAKGATAATTTAVTTTDGVSKAKAADITVAGTAANFEITQTGTGSTGEYKYSEKSGVKDRDWDYVDISLKGACSKAETTDDLVAPKFALTWSWVDPAAGPQVSVGADGKITMSGLTSEKLWAGLSISFTKEGTAETFVLDSDNRITWDNSNYSRTTGGTTIASFNQAWKDYCAGLSVTATLKLSDGTTVSGTGTIASN